MYESDRPAPPSRGTPVWVWFAVFNALVVVVGGLGFWYIIERLPKAAPIAAVPPTPAPQRPAKPAAPEAENETLAAIRAAGQPATPPAEMEEPESPAAPGGADKSSDRASVSSVIKQVENGIVLVTTYSSKGKKLAFGSGFVIDGEGLVATNFHVLEGATTAKATFHDGHEVDIVGCRGWSATDDLAILQLKEVPADVKVLSIAETTTEVADDVIAVGHPQGFDFTTTTGIVSAVRKTADLPAGYRQRIDAPDDNLWIQTNAAISGGNSGGPLLNMGGAVVGINTWIAEGENLGFAVDASHLRSLRDALQAEPVLLADLTGPQETQQAIAAEFVNKYRWFAEQFAEAKTVAAKEKLLAQQHPALETIEKLVKLVEKHPQSPAAFDSLSVICQIAALPDCPAESGPQIEIAGKQLLDTYVKDPRLEKLLLQMRSTRLPQGRDLMRRIVTESPEKRVQGMGRFCLAVALSQPSSPTAEADDPDFTEEGVQLLDEIVKDYADIVVGSTTLGEACEGLLFVARNLAIGKTPPEISGVDQEGKEFKLSEYRGKVVVLDFWADWCPHCVAMYPLERKLVKDMQDKPFALLGINADEPSRFERAIKDGRVTWRNWVDGPEGPIIASYHVEGFPTLYVLDHEGVIRYKNVRDKELLKAVKELLAKVPGQPAEAATSEKPADEKPAEGDTEKPDEEKPAAEKSAAEEPDEEKPDEEPAKPAE